MRGLASAGADIDKPAAKHAAAMASNIFLMLGLLVVDTPPNKPTPCDASGFTDHEKITAK
jgi:hypothetical protein